MPTAQATAPELKTFEDVVMLFGAKREAILHALLLNNVHLVRFELAMLAELGFGLDLSRCAATGAADDLGYVSPKSGRAVSRTAGEPWHDRLLPLPAFLLDDAPARPSAGELAEGFAVTGFFLGRYVFEPRGMRAPDARERFIAAVQVPAHSAA